MTWKPEGHRIVQTWPGPGTSCDDRYIKTEDGTVWRQEPIMMDYSGATCPPRMGRLVNGRVIG